MKSIKKRVLSVALSVVMLYSTAMPVLAAAPSTTAGTANVLDFSLESVVVPTTLKVALNPKSYDVTTRYNRVEISEGDTPDEDTTYYTEAAGVYTKATFDEDDPAFEDDVDYYTAETSNSQIVSLNYGLVNKSTLGKNVSIEFAATYEPSTEEGKKAIEFVDTVAKAQAYDESTNEDGAKTGELKMYLAVASATAAPTAKTFAKATTYDENEDRYFTKSGSTFTKVGEVADEDTFKAGEYYVETTTIGTEITAAQLADVSMTAATAGVQKFEPGTTDKADASIAYKLDTAEYSLKDGELIDFSTTQDDLADLLELDTLGGVAGFTFIGTLNADADWTTADTTAISITPTYTITDSDGEETAIANTQNQIESIPIVSMTSAGVITISNLTADRNYKSSKLTVEGVDYEIDRDKNITWATDNWSSSEGGRLGLSMQQAWITATSGKKVTITVTLTDDSTISTYATIAE